VHSQTKELKKIERKGKELSALNGGGLCAAFSCPNPSKIELASESGKVESVQIPEVTGTRWMLDFGVPGWCTLLASFGFCNEFGSESVVLPMRIDTTRVIGTRRRMRSSKRSVS
jgi:hypothetical protein